MNEKIEKVDLYHWIKYMKHCRTLANRIDSCFSGVVETAIFSDYSRYPVINNESGVTTFGSVYISVYETISKNQGHAFCSIRLPEVTNEYTWKELEDLSSNIIEEWLEENFYHPSKRSKESEIDSQISYIYKQEDPFNINHSKSAPDVVTKIRL